MEPFLMSEFKTQEYTVKKTQNNINITPDVAINFVNRRAINLYFNKDRSSFTLRSFLIVKVY